MMDSSTFRTRIVVDESLSAIRIPFDPKTLFGVARPPVVVTVNGYAYRTTIANMGDGPLVPLRRSHREAAGLRGGETVDVHIALDTAPRVVKAPADLVTALKRRGALKAWNALSFTHQREHVEAIEEARKPETRARRIERAMEMVAARSTGVGRKGKTRSRG